VTGWQPIKALPDLRRAGRVALDIETADHRLQAELGSGWATAEGHVAGVSVAYRADGEIRSHYIPIRHPNSNNFPVKQVFSWLKDLVASDVHIVGHNLLYDLGWLETDGGVAVPASGRLDDTGALATMIDENRRSYSLDNLCKWRGLQGKDETALREAIETLLGIKCGTRKNPPQAFIAQLPARFVELYAAQDAASTLALYEDLYPTLKEEGTHEAYRLEIDLLPMVLQMRRRGIRVDIAAAACNRDILLQKRDTVFAKLAEKLGRRVDMEDIGSVAWLAENCDRLGIKYPHTESGKPSFRRGPLGWMDRHPHWFPQLVVKADVYNTAATNFLERHVLGHAVNGRIHPEVHPHRSEENGTKSFRFSYSNPPLQQMPSHDEEITQLVRSVFLPEEGEFWASCDQSQQEFRLLVAEAAKHGLDGAHKAAERYRNDPSTDFHQFVADLTKLSRLIAKSVNFGMVYRTGPRKFALTTGLPEAEALKIYEHYNHELPFPQALAVLIQRQVERDGYLKLLDGARRHFNEWEVRDFPWQPGMAPCGIEEARRRVRDPTHPWFSQRLQRSGAYTAVNALIQGNAARQTKLWMLGCWREGIVPLLQMHDALELSVASPGQADRVAQLGRDAVSLSVPMQVDRKYGRTWADAEHAWADIPATVPEVAAVNYQPPPPILATRALHRRHGQPA
jgi:DNA polymerase I-like protein with 3'-5' exonuclease and polymerase domains